MTLNGMILPLIVGLVAVGSGLLVHALLSAIGDIVQSLPAVLWSRRHRAQLRVRQLAQQEPTPATSKSRVDTASRMVTDMHALAGQPLAWLAFAVLVALPFADILKSTAIATVVMLVGLNVTASIQSARDRALARDTRELIYQFTARFPLLRSVSATLQATLAELRPGEVRAAIETILRDLALARPAKEAFEPLRHLPSPALARMADLLAQAQQIDQRVFTATLADLEAQVHSQEALARKSRQETALLGITQRVLQVLLAASLIVAGFLGQWRSYFLVEGRWVTYVGMALVALVGTYYVQTQTRAIEVQG